MNWLSRIARSARASNLSTIAPQTGSWRAVPIVPRDYRSGAACPRGEWLLRFATEEPVRHGSCVVRFFVRLINFVPEESAGERLTQRFQCAGANLPGSLDLFGDAGSLNENSSGIF